MSLYSVFAIHLHCQLPLSLPLFRLWYATISLNTPLTTHISISNYIWGASSRLCDSYLYTAYKWAPAPSNLTSSKSCTIACLNGKTTTMDKSITQAESERKSKSRIKITITSSWSYMHRIWFLPFRQTEHLLQTSQHASWLRRLSWDMQ